jgi:hypothetical protein
MPGVILGIHSNVSKDSDDFSSGHAWVSITRNVVTTYYGLWPDGHPRTTDNGDDSDIRIGLEQSKGVAARYYRLTNEQEMILNRLLRENVHWFYTNNCSSWASEIIYRVVGEDVDADDFGGVETPRELGRNILLLETRSPSSLRLPRPPRAQASSSSVN